MELKEISKTKFDAFAFNHPQASFQQSSYWAHFKEGEGFHTYCLVLEEKNQIIAGTRLLAKEQTIFKKRYFYAPRGFLIDYKNEDLLRKFTELIIKFIKEKKGIMLKIDPNVAYQKRDNKGSTIPGSFIHDYIKQNLQNVGFKENYLNTIQPKWLYKIDLRNKDSNEILKELSSKARQIIHTRNYFSFHFDEVPKKELDTFISLIQGGNKQNGIIEYQLPFYQDLLTSFKEDKIKFISVKLNVEETKKKIEVKLEYFNKIKNNYSKKHNIYKQKINSLQNIRKKLDTIPNNIIVGTYLFVLDKNEVTLLQSKINPQYKFLNTSYLIQYYFIEKMLEKHYMIYNLYEISNPSDQGNLLFSKYQYYQHFGGNVIEMLGEFDYIIDKNMYIIFKHFFPKYYGIKTVKTTNK